MIPAQEVQAPTRVKCRLNRKISASLALYREVVRCDESHSVFHFLCQGARSNGGKAMEIKKVAIVMGSDSDLPIVKPAIEKL